MLPLNNKFVVHVLEAGKSKIKVPEALVSGLVVAGYRWPPLDSTNVTLAPPAFAGQEIEDQLPTSPTKVCTSLFGTSLSVNSQKPINLKEMKLAVSAASSSHWADIMRLSGTSVFEGSQIPPCKQLEELSTSMTSPSCTSAKRSLVPLKFPELDPGGQLPQGYSSLEADKLTACTDLHLNRPILPGSVQLAYYVAPGTSKEKEGPDIEGLVRGLDFLAVVTGVIGGVRYDCEFNKSENHKETLILSLSCFQAEKTKNFVSRSLVIGDILSMADMATGVKCGIIYWLFGGAIRNLGSPEHVTKWFQPLQEQKYTGMFATTKRGHGSNVRGIQTEATFDLSAQEFVIDTPCEDAEKMYIGNAMYGNYAAVFAQLIIDGRSQGPHCFIVPVWDENGRLYPGVTAIDMTYKEGLHGVDNGILIFHKVRIPGENLLDKFGSVAPDGQYHSPIRNKSARFNVMLAALTPSRLAVAFQAPGVMKVWLLC
ncbi:uncharacterized protein LOC135273007 [Aotus nancymaae]|uniref:uncharacterized protein LOC135273007 n=1 Tax=Aotus nancymaae TaxID=37293 RepID=UPI0030FE9740